MQVTERDEIVIVDKNETVKSEDYGFPFYRNGLVYGIVSGLLMSAISLLAAGFTGEGVTALDFLKYIVLGLALGVLLNRYKEYLPSGKIFKDGLQLGLFTSVVAALTLSLINLLGSTLGMESAFFNKFGLEVDSFANALVVNGLLVMEGIVFGGILTFVWLQFLKDAKPAE